MDHDVLSDLLRRVRLRGALFFHVDCVGAWVTEAPASSLIASVVMPGSEHLMEYHVVLAGECWAGVAGESAVHMSAGDVIVFPHGDPHVMSSVPGLRAQPDLEFLSKNNGSQRPFMVRQQDDQPVQLATGPRSDGSGATLLCGFLGCDRGPFNPLLSALPPLIHARSAELPGLGWAVQLSRLAADEAGKKSPGGEAVLERMSEMMFIDIMRHHLETMPENSSGWLAGLRDRYVGKVLGLIHERPAEAWTLDRLSCQAGLSRSALHDRFVSLVNQPPMQYLQSWRMQLASNLLVETNAKLATIARDVGYESEAAFSRTFKRVVGMPPATWRKSRTRSRTESLPTA